MLGKWCKLHGERQVISALATAQVSHAVEPISWIEHWLDMEPRHRDLNFGRDAARAAAQALIESGEIVIEDDENPGV
jgi:hypothetical protein